MVTHNAGYQQNPENNVKFLLALPPDSSHPRSGWRALVITVIMAPA